MKSLRLEAEIKTVVQYLELAQGMSEAEFAASFAHPVFIEKLGTFPHERASLMSGTVVESDVPDLEKLEAEFDPGKIHSARVFPLRRKADSSGPEIRIGRAPSNDIILPSSSVSRLHAQLVEVRGGEHYQLLDLFSSNGTFLNGEKVHSAGKHEIKDRDQIGFGLDYVLIYYSPDGFYDLLKSLTS